MHRMGFILFTLSIPFAIPSVLYEPRRQHAAELAFE
jgi:hypothetical protein